MKKPVIAFGLVLLGFAAPSVCAQIPTPNDDYERVPVRRDPLEEISPGLAAAASVTTGLPLGLPPAAAEPELFELAHESPAIFVAWGKVQSPSADSSNRTEQLLADPEVQRFFAELGKFIESGFDAGMRSDEDDQFAGFIKQSLPGVVSNSTTLSVQLRPELRIAAATRLPDDRKSITNFLAIVEAEGRVSPAEIEGHQVFRVGEVDLEVVFGVVGDNLIVTVGQDEFSATVRRLKTGTRPSWLNETLARIPVDRIGSLSYVDLPQLLPPGAEAEDTDPVQSLLNGIGRNSVQSFACVTGLDKDATVVRTLVRSPALSAVASSFVANTVLVPDDFECVPADVRVAVGLKATPQAMFEAGTSLISVLEGQRPGQIREEVRRGLKSLRVDVDDEILSSLGDEWCLYQSPSEGGALFTGWTLIASVHDRDQLTGALDKLHEAFNAMNVGAGIRSTAVEGNTIYHVFEQRGQLPVAPAWCVTNDKLIISTYPQGVLAVLNRPDSTPRLSGSASLIKRLDAHQPMLLVHGDEAELASVLQPFVLLGFSSAPSELPREIRDMSFPDITSIPSLPVLVRHLDQFQTLMSLKTDGAEVTRYQTIPPGGFQVVAAGEVFGGLFESEFDSLQKSLNPELVARENLRTLTYSMHSYHDAHDTLPAAASVDEDGKPLLSWRVHLLPFMGYGDLYRRFNLDEPWDSPNNKTLIAEMPEEFRSAESLAPAGMTTFVSARSAGSVMPPGFEEVALYNIEDGISNTVLLLETDDKHAVTWTKPDDLRLTRTLSLPQVLRKRKGGYLTSFADGSIRHVRADLTDREWSAIVTIDDGEIIDIGDSEWGYTRTARDAALDAESREAPDLRDSPTEAPPRAMSREVERAVPNQPLDFGRNRAMVLNVIAEAGSRAAAVETFREAARNNPDDYLAFYNLGTNYNELKQYEEAREALQQCVEMRPDVFEGIYQLGIAAFCLDDNHGAIELFSKAVEMQPESSMSWLYKALSHHSEGEAATAFNDYTRSIELDPDQGFAYYRRAAIHTAENRTAEAIADYTSAASLRPNDRNVFYFRAFQYEAAGQIEEAIADLSRAIEIAPDDTLALQHRGRFYSDGDQFEPAIRDFTALIELDKDNAAGWSGRAGCLLEKGDYDKALADYNAAIALDPNRYNLMNRGMCNENKGDYTAAIADYNSALNMDPGSAFALSQRGWCHWKLKAFGAAKADYLKSFEVGGAEDVISLGNASWLLASCPDADVRDGKLALEYGRKACDLTDWKKSWIIDNVAASYAELAEFNRAIAYAEMAISIADTDEEKADIRTRLELYKQKKPARAE